MDTNIGTFQLTDNQKTQFYVTKPIAGLGWSLWEDGSVVVVSQESLTFDQIYAIKNQINNFPDTPNQTYLQSIFSVDKFVIDLNSALSADSNMFQYYAAVKDWAYYKNFTQMKLFLETMLTAGSITQEEHDAVYQCTLNQGVDLSKL